MFQCSEGHLFCRECTTMHIETKLGEQRHVSSLSSHYPVKLKKQVITCMDTSSCSALFPESELTRVLSDRSLHLYHRLKQASELESAGLIGLETCPQCPYSAIIENPDEKLFRCQAPDCGVISCRKCRRIEHLPKTCEGESAFSFWPAESMS
jgi:TRIAD3 protein (E3 ubiquitin-protein ligase RNF216)